MYKVDSKHLFRSLRKIGSTSLKILPREQIEFFTTKQMMEQPAKKSEKNLCNLSDEI